MEQLFGFLLVLNGTPADRCRVLDTLDLVRQAAYARADPTLLDLVYATGPELDQERALLASWTNRGIRFERIRTERRSCELVGTSVAVQERLGSATAVLPDGSRRTLPHDAWEHRTIHFVRDGGHWRIDSVVVG